ncbi:MULTISPECIES: ribonuclease J [Marinomonas]|uniref:Ribonuclease J n=1 Tax=Marinomonas arctica TaxID=383750 RepID=A0A7H1J491_9GAMM|nr:MULTISPECIES: ribonuclease J [Marinomonas]QNT05307.1 ribonuclease J [Marinomonas arctica]GGN37111.1 MBL fold hydrolase [Marinomonas arctica]
MDKIYLLFIHKECVISSLIPSREDLWFLPLGGTGEIGMNMNLYGHDGQWLMVDCGVSFNEPLSPDDLGTSEIVCADPRFISEQKERLVGIVITHAHEDHVGALPFLWRRFKCPVYTTAFTAEVLRRKLVQVGLTDQVPIIEVAENESKKIGVFNVKWLGLTHSIPEPFGMTIATSAGKVFHTGDWKIDKKPLLGDAFSPTAFKALAKDNILAMVCDSTNALKEGFSPSESDCYDGLLKTIAAEKNRVVVGCFSSNVARLVALGRVAKETGRYLALIGRSLTNMVSAARVTGHWPDDLPIIEAAHLGYLPKEEVLAVVTGSQGEPRATLSRLAANNCFDLSLDADDLVIFSAMRIPGNEQAIDRLVAQFKGRKIRTLQAHETNLMIHVSGHPCREELKQLYAWVQPQIAIPVHGEPKHLDANADVARLSHVPQQLVGRNGDLYQLAPSVSVRRQQVKVGRIALLR